MRRLNRNKRGIADDIWGWIILGGIVLAGLILGRKQLGSWAHTLGKAKAQFQIGGLEGETELLNARNALAKAKQDTENLVHH